MTVRLVILLTAMLLDRMIGDPARIWQKIPHPVALFGLLIGAFDRRLNRCDRERSVRRRNGIISLSALIALSLVAGLLLTALFRSLGYFGVAAEIVVVSVFLAQKSLGDHVIAVAKALRVNLAEGRKAVAHIVGRDPDKLNSSGVARAAIESLAENFSDGVVAPVLWYGLLGLPGLLAYKMINTADSMIGHRNSRYEDYGYAAARIDDLVNWPAARLSALVIALAAAGSAGKVHRIVETSFRDAGLHRSPNAGWPEAAMAAGLGLALAGPRKYESYEVTEPYINAGGRTDADAGDIDNALALYTRSCTVLAGIVVAAMIISATL